MTLPVKVTYYLEVLSSWCHWAEPAWAELKARYAGRATFDWKIALLNPGDFPASRAQSDWYYRRSGGTVMNSPYMLNSGWFEASRKGDYDAPNLVAEAARDLGATGDAVRLALTEAALREGRKIGDLGTAVAVAAKAGRLTPRKLRARAQSAAIAAQVAASTAQFHAHQITQRPAFILEGAIGDKAVFSGLVRIEPLAAAVEAMLRDTAAYVAHAAHHPPAPQA
jgi:predicted DsbA family dithiol-disulfide isomerase